MKINKIEIDTLATGKNILELSDFTIKSDFLEFEKDYIQKEKPFYVLLKIPVEELSTIHIAEACGFQFIEMQIKMTHKLKKRYPGSKQFEFVEVTNQDDVKKIQDFAGTTFIDDRLVIDPLIDSETAYKRHVKYIISSYKSDNQKLYKLVEVQSNKIVAFKTHKYLENNEVLLLLGGVLPIFKNLGVGLINGYAELNELQKQGKQRVFTHISARNSPIMNMEIGALNFKVVQSYLVLRKIYK